MNIWQKRKLPCSISANVCMFINASSTTFPQFLFNPDLETWCLHINSKIHPAYTLIIVPILSLAVVISNYNQYLQNKVKAIIHFMTLQERHSDFSKEIPIALEITTVFKTQTSQQAKTKRPSTILSFKIFVSLLNNLQK